MKVLLKKREEDKEELEDNVTTNVKELIAPFFNKIKKTKLDDQQKTFLSIIESNLNEIISPFTRKMSLKYLNLTPTEIHVANLIKHGSNTKNIADLMNLSVRTIYNHRKNIRKKIGLKSKRTSLRSYLLSLHWTAKVSALSALLRTTGFLGILYPYSMGYKRVLTFAFLTNNGYTYLFIYLHRSTYIVTPGIY